MALRLVNAATATSSAPTLATDGFALNGHTPGTGQYYWLKVWDAGEIMVNASGTGALTFQGIIWLYSNVAGCWMPAGISSTVADRGKLNDGTTITGTTTLTHTQPIQALSAFERIAFQITTSTAGAGNLTSSVYLVQRYMAV